MRIMRRIGQILSVTSIVLYVYGSSLAGASSANISHSYGSSDSLPIGSLVSLDPLKSNYVVLANTTNGSQLLGVVVDSKDSLLAVDSSSEAGSVQVATSGTVNTLVSDVNGAIKVGDQISVSPFNGIGMKASVGQQVIGLAQNDFNTKDPSVKVESATDRKGKVSQVKVGYLSIGVGIGIKSAGDGVKLNTLQQIAKSLTGHTVSTFRAALGLIITVAATVALVVLIYASIYGGIISIGRNPLAKYAVFRSLLSVFGMAALTAFVASVTVYLLLR